MALYNEKIMEHFKNPRNVGIIEDASGVGEARNSDCGDITRIYLKIKEDMIKDVKFETFGCATAIASSSIATELIKGKSVCNALTLTIEDISNELDGLPEEKIHCSVLAHKAIQEAIDDYYSKEPEKYITEENTNQCNCNHHCCCNNKGCGMC